jgi:type I restriction enzyme S subunit
MIADLKPYPEYRESELPWLGRCPKNWGVRRTKVLFRERVQKGFPDEPLLAATQSKGVVKKGDYGKRTVTAQKDLHLLKLVETGDYVISLRSFEGGIEVAHCRGIISPAYTVLKPSEQASTGYYSHFFKSKQFVDSLSLFVTGIREGQNIDYQRLSRAEMPFPLPEEQEAIVRFLDYANAKIDRYVRAKKKLITLLNEQKQAIIHQAVTRGLNPDVPLKDSGVEWLGEIPKHWELLPVKRCAVVISKGTTPSTEGREFLDAGLIRFIKAENVSGGAIVDKPKVFIDQETHNILRRSQLRENDILFVIAGATLGKVAIVRSLHLPANTNQAVAFIRPNQRVIPEFLAVWLQSSRIKEQIWLNAVQSAQPNLSMGSLGKFPTPVPPLDEQTEVVKRIEAELSMPNAAITRTEREIELLNEYRTKLTADMVTGKLDVREAAAKLPTIGNEPDTVLDEEVDLEEV